jgi:outer membrane protein OmpA-like peptidoglycan-associated protein
MKTTMFMVAGLALSLAGTGCATKKYVAKTIAPVEQRVTSTEGKNTEQDQKLTAQSAQIEGVDRDLSRAKEKLADVDNKAGAAADAARSANDAAKQADSKAQGAQQSADGAQTTAQRGLQGLSVLSRNVEGMLKYKELTSGTVLFGVAKKTLDDKAKSSLDDLAKQIGSADRFVVEIQGYTDKTGDAEFNEVLSQDRAQSVARYLANEHKIPLRTITVLGTGIATGDQKTRDERAQARKVDVRIYVPETVTAATTASN